MTAAGLRKTVLEPSTAKDRPVAPTLEAPDVPKSSKRIKKRLPPELDPGPLSNEPEMDSDLQYWTIFTLMSSISWTWRDRTDYYVGANLSIYYYVNDSKSGRRHHRKLVFRGPDFFVALNPFPKPRRNSWVVDNEGGKYPDFILEVLSPKTKKNDQGEKKTIYERTFATHEYFLVDPVKETLSGYRLTRGRYVPVEPSAEGFLWSERLGFYVGMHEDSRWGKLARLFTLEKKLVALPPEEALEQMARAERVEQEKARDSARVERAEQEKALATARAERAEQQTQRAEQQAQRFREKLRLLGVQVDAIDDD